MVKLVECVPNFSEGRDRAIIDTITAEISGVAGATLLDVDPGEATNRTVVTFVGTPEAAVEAAFRAIAKAAALIDMQKHKGEHPRQGATDVCPFVPVSEMSVQECVTLAHTLAKRVGDELGIPVFLYEEAATRPERRSLADIRAGEYEALEEKLKRPEFKPDYGPVAFNARSGVTVIGVRPFLIAYNINLNTRNTKIAKNIGLTIREKGRIKRDKDGKKLRDSDGNFIRQPGFPNCRATGWFIEEYGRAQVTMNLTNYHVTAIHTVFDRVEEEAMRLGARVTGSEIVGLVPKEAMLIAGRHYLKKQGMTTGVSDQELINIAILSLGLNEVAPFDPAQKIIEYRVSTGGRLESMKVNEFVDELASNSPAPGGGSVAALAASMGAGLTSMVAALTFGKEGYLEHNPMMEDVGVGAHKLKAMLLAAMDADTDAFNKVMNCFAMPKKTEAQQMARNAALEEANKQATLIPLGVLEHCPEILELVSRVEASGNQNSLSDAGVAGLMVASGAYGAFYNVFINLQGIQDQAWIADIRKRAEAALAKVNMASGRIKESVLKKLRQTLPSQ